MPLIDNSLTKNKTAQFKLSAWHRNQGSSSKNWLLTWKQTSELFISGVHTSIKTMDELKELPKSGFVKNEDLFLLDNPYSPTNERFWATPDASNSNDGESVESWLVRREKVKEKLHNGNGAGMPLAVMVKAFDQPPTPQEKTTLIWPTPTAGDAKNHCYAGKKDEINSLWLPGAVNVVSGLPINGVPKFKINPSWVEWLMGFPLEWSKATVIL